MKKFSRTYLPEEIDYKGKVYIKDYSFNEFSTPTSKHIEVAVLAMRLQGERDLRGNLYQPRKHTFIEVKDTLARLVRPLNARYGSPMGRANVGDRPTDGTKVFDCYLPMSADEAYDTGSAYWGCGSRMRVSYTKDLDFVEYYREVLTLRA